MTTTFAREGKLYSVDMLIAYVNIFKPGVIQIPLISLSRSIEKPCWKEPSTGAILTIQEVLDDPEKYPDHSRRINNADLSYPVIVSRNYGMLDGKHRLAKAVRDKQDTISAYLVSNEVIEKCVIHGGPDDWDIIQQQLKPYQLIALFHKRFR